MLSLPVLAFLTCVPAYTNKPCQQKMGRQMSSTLRIVSTASRPPFASVNTPSIHMNPFYYTTLTTQYVQLLEQSRKQQGAYAFWRGLSTRRG